MDEQNFDPPHRWFDLCYRNNIDINIAIAMCEKLVDAYSGPNRHYHSMTHVYSCLNLLDGLPVSGQTKDILEFATWFHDYIYDPQSDTNELESAEFASNWLAAQNVPYANEVKEIIELTADHGNEVLTDDVQQIFHDLDMAILGANSDDYMHYARSIRKEYEHLTDKEYRTGRASFLSAVDKKEAIYKTDAFRDLFELNARENIRSELANLEKK